MTESKWRTHARPVIQRVLKETEGKPEDEIRRAIRDAYPFGERRHHPYKIWLDEVARQLRLRSPGPKASLVPDSWLPLFKDRS
jgi:hypothetical protein